MAERETQSRLGQSRQGEVPAVFVNLTEPPAVAKRLPMPPDLLEAIGVETGNIVVAQPVSLAEIRSDFPDLPVWGYRDG